MNSSVSLSPMTQFNADLSSRLSKFFQNLHNKRILSEPESDSLLIYTQANLSLTLKSDSKQPITQSKSLSFHSDTNSFEFCLVSNMGNPSSNSKIPLLSAKMMPRVSLSLTSHLIQTISKQSLSGKSQVMVARQDFSLFEKENKALKRELQIFQQKREEEKKLFFQKTCLLVNQKKEKIRELSEDAKFLIEENRRLKSELEELRSELEDRPKKKVKRGSAAKKKKKK